MKYEGLIEEIRMEVETGAKVPFSNTRMVDSEKLLNLIDDLLEILPAELTEADSVVRHQTEIIQEAQTQAAQIVADAETRAAQLVEEHAVTQEAYKQAGEIVQDAQNSAAEVRESANQFLNDVMADLESSVQRVLTQVQQTRSQM